MILIGTYYNKFSDRNMATSLPFRPPRARPTENRLTDIRDHRNHNYRIDLSLKPPFFSYFQFILQKPEFVFVK